MRGKGVLYGIAKIIKTNIKTPLSFHFQVNISNQLFLFEVWFTLLYWEKPSHMAKKSRNRKTF